MNVFKNLRHLATYEIIAILSFAFFILIVPTVFAEVKVVENVKSVTVPYENKTSSLISKFATNVTDLFWRFNGSVSSFDYEAKRERISEDSEFLKLKSVYAKEVEFVKALEGTGVVLSDIEKNAFFKYLGSGKADYGFASLSGSENSITKIVSYEKDKETVFMRIQLDVGKSSITISERKEGTFQTVYGGKTEIPKESVPYSMKAFYSKTNRLPYLAIWFHTKKGIGVSISSISHSGEYVSLVSDVTGLFINGDYSKPFKPETCDPKLKHFIVKESSLIGYCLKKGGEGLAKFEIIR